MDFCFNVTVSDGFPSEYHSQPSSTSLDDLFPGQNMEGDVSLEWLSIFVEDCLSSRGNCLTIPTTHDTTNNPTKPIKPINFENTTPSLHKFVIPGKARSKRKRAPLTTWTHQQTPLLKQAYWLADSELIVPKKVVVVEEEEEEVVMGGGGGGGDGVEGGNNGARRCSHCLSQRTPQWRAGPMGPKTLCNACGVRYKSGRLLPEYRPAKSPTFVSYKHSNSHKKVLEMRMSSTPNTIQN